MNIGPCARWLSKMARRAPGSNQYRTRRVPEQPDWPDRQRHLGRPDRMKCGEVWGTACRAWVYPQRFTHGRHLAGRAMQSRGRVTVINPGCSSVGLREIARMPPTPWRPCLHQAVLQHPHCDDTVLLVMSTNPDARIQHLVAIQPQCPPQVLQHMALAATPAVQQAVAGHRHCPPDVLDQLAATGIPQVRQAVASNPGCRLTTLRLLAQEADPDIAQAATFNPNCSVPILRSLAGHRYSGVRCGVAQHHRTPIDMLIRLAQDEDPEVRQEARANPNLPDEYLALMPVAH